MNGLGWGGGVALTGSRNNPEVSYLYEDMENDKTMNKHILPILLAGLLCFSVFPAVAQTDRFQPVDKTSLEGSRYEIVIPTRDEIPSLFKLDKYTGDVWVLPNDLVFPHKLTLFTREPSENDIVKEGMVNYQLIAVSSSEIYLINLNTGILWEYTNDLFRRRGWVFRLVENME